MTRVTVKNMETSLKGEICHVWPGSLAFRRWKLIKKMSLGGVGAVQRHSHSPPGDTVPHAGLPKVGALIHVSLSLYIFKKYLAVSSWMRYSIHCPSVCGLCEPACPDGGVWAPPWPLRVLAILLTTSYKSGNKRHQLNWWHPAITHRANSASAWQWATSWI